MSDKAYRMPFVEVNMAVLWYPDGDSRQQPHAAVVTGIGHDSINVNILLPNSYNFMIRDGCRHVSDPRTKQQERLDGGTWDYTPLTRRLLKVLDELEPKKEAKKP